MCQILNGINVVDNLVEKAGMEELLEEMGCFKVGEIEIGSAILLEELGIAFKKIMDEYLGTDFVSEYLEEEMRESERKIRLKSYQKEKISKSIVELKKNFMNQYLDRVKGILTEEEFAEILESVNCEKVKLESELSELEKVELLEIERYDKMKNINLEEILYFDEDMMNLFVSKVELYEKVDQSKDDKMEVIVYWNI